MNDIKCPKCGNIFQIDETDYNSIVKQVRDKEFTKEIDIREEQYKTDVKLAKISIEKDLNDKLNSKDLEITELKNELRTKEEITQIRIEKNFTEDLSKKEIKINELESEIKSKEMEKEFAIKEAITELEKEKRSMKDSYEEQLAYYKDLKARQSTKLIGETLEQHCSNEFNKLRPLFRNAYFEKDNDIATGSKGDFIYRDYDDDGTEIVSIMFEMKNQSDSTSTKHRNEDFFKELDKDRKEKNCEYAVLVSLLEIDNEYYNTGIVDVSHIYNKMYVIRPQFFIPLITLIRNMSFNSLEYKKNLEEIKNQNIDISNFEDNINTFKDSFGRNYRLASEKFKTAIDEIDKTISHLQKTKDALLSSVNNLRIANNKAEDLSIKKLTHNSETMAKMFEVAKK